MRTIVTATLIALLTGGIAAAETYGDTKGPNIVDVASKAGTFTTLVTALKVAGLVEALQGEGPFTVFAPTDEAFAKLPAGTLEALLKDVPKLKEILLYHVVPGKVTAAQVVSLSKAATLQGSDVAISAGKDGVKINDARVITTDVMASNGVIHLIDAVILPPAK